MIISPSISVSFKSQINCSFNCLSTSLSLHSITDSHNLLIHSPTFSPFCLLNLQNYSDFIISLNWDVNLLVKNLNKPSNVLHLSSSAFVNNSMNCRPYLPNKFFTITSFSVRGVLYIVSVLLTSNLKVLSSLYLSSASKLKVGCFMAVCLFWSWYTLWPLCHGCCHTLNCCSGCLWYCLGCCFICYCLFTCYFALLS